MADERIQYTEQMVGAGHPTLSDTLNRLALVEHNSDGTHNKLTGVTDPWVDIRAYLPAGYVTDGTVDYSSEIQAALDTKMPVLLPKGRWYTGSTTVRSYPYQVVRGDGIDASIIRSDASVGLAVADTNGDYSLTSKELSFASFLRDFSVQTTAANSTGIRFAGVLYGGMENIKAERATDEGAGFRTGHGIVIMGLDKTTNRGCYYNTFCNLRAEKYGNGIVLGARTHQNGPLVNPVVSSCDYGVRDDDGTLFSFQAGNKAHGALHHFTGGAIEIINNNAFHIASTGRTVIECPYIDTVTGNGIDVSGTGAIVQVMQPYFSGVAGTPVTHSAGKVFILGMGTGVEPNDFGVDTREALLAYAPFLSRMYSDSGVTNNVLANPKIISGIETINGDDVNSYAAATVTFNGYGDLPTNLCVAGVWGGVISTAAGTVSNSLYNVGFSSVNPYATDTNLLIQIRGVTGAAISSTAAVRVQWFAIVYTP